MDKKPTVSTIGLICNISLTNCNNVSVRTHSGYFLNTKKARTITPEKVEQ